MGSLSATASYYIYQTRDCDGTIAFEAIATNKVEDRAKQLRTDYIEAYKAWKQAAKEAEAAGQKFDDPKPAKPGMVKAYSKKICGKEKAQSLASLFQEKWEAKQRKKDAESQDELKDDGPAKDKEAKGKAGGPNEKS